MGWHNLQFTQNSNKKNTFPHTVAKRRATRKLQQKKSPPKNPTVLIKDGGAPGKKKPEIKLVSSAGNIQFCIASKWMLMFDFSG